MKANELKIGNSVLNDRCINTIENLLSDGICTLKTKQGNFIHAQYDMIEPIPLTEEWLIKFGFEKIGSNYQKDWLLLHKNIRTGTIDFILSEPITRIIKATVLEFVHQLQNLYFALTGSELTIKK